MVEGPPAPSVLAISPFSCFPLPRRKKRGKKRRGDVCVLPPQIHTFLYFTYCWEVSAHAAPVLDPRFRGVLGCYFHGLIFRRLGLPPLLPRLRFFCASYFLHPRLLFLRPRGPIRPNRPRCFRFFPAQGPLGLPASLHFLGPPEGVKFRRHIRGLGASGKNPSAPLWGSASTQKTYILRPSLEL